MNTSNIDALAKAAEKASAEQVLSIFRRLRMTLPV